MLRDEGAFSGGMIEGDWGSQSGYDAAMRMPLDQGITGVVVANDQMALGALKALEERGVRVPEDMSVVGFDDIPEAQFLKPSLTTIGLDFDRQGRMAMDQLLSMIDPRIAVLHKQPLAPDLVVRKSSGPAAGR
jgi:LacI family transcriptional regulator